jgi:hypothetical protein
VFRFGRLLLATKKTRFGPFMSSALDMQRHTKEIGHAPPTRPSTAARRPPSGETLSSGRQSSASAAARRARRAIIFKLKVRHFMCGSLPRHGGLTSAPKHAERSKLVAGMFHSSRRASEGLPDRHNLAGVGIVHVRKTGRRAPWIRPGPLFCMHVCRAITGTTVLVD